jgi:Na+/melibiose symporter-like transporter
MVADLAKQDNELYGQDRSASMYSFFTLFLKFGNAFAASIPYLILGLFSVFDPSLGLNNTSESLDLLWNLYIFIPIICYILAALIIKQYKHNV